MRNDSSSLKRYGIAFCISCTVFSISIFILNYFSTQIDTELTDIPISALLMFYGYLVIIYAMSVQCWKVFSSTSAVIEHRTFSESFIDTGLISVGKYIPGKAVGILARGAFKDGSFVMSKASVASSASEQVYSLCVGLVLVISFLCYQYLVFHVIWVTIFLLAALSYLPLIASQLLKKTPLGIYIPRITPRKAFALSLAYVAVWLISSMPILTLISTAYDLEFIMTFEILAAFTSSIIAGWLAFISPGGIGVREAAFALTAPEWLDWKEGMFWIMMHRTLCIFFDIVYGGISIALFSIQLRSRNLKQKYT